MAVNKTSLSAGEIFSALLNADAEVKARTKKIYPVVADKADLPYVVYRRTQLSQDPTKAGRGADAVGIEVLCFTAQYTEGVELAEAVRAALEYKQSPIDGFPLRSCYLADSEEAWQDDAFVQQLVFNVKI